MATTCNAPVVRLPTVAGLDVEATLFGGQAFRWRRADGGAAEGWIGPRPVRVRADDGGLEVVPLDGVLDGLATAAFRYFDADRDYGAAELRLARDARLRAIASGVRILRQPPFETLVSFVVSANNNIPRISRAIELLAALAGRDVFAGGVTRRAFPEPAALAEIDSATLRRDANLGYRDKYVAEIARIVACGAVDLEALERLPTSELRTALAGLPGVGPKVADCVALFAYGRLDVFPVDTWVRRAYAELYLNGERATDREIVASARRRFGAYAGLAQQYLFETARREGRAAARSS